MALTVVLACFVLAIAHQTFLIVSNFILTMLVLAMVFPDKNWEPMSNWSNYLMDTVRKPFSKMPEIQLTPFHSIKTDFLMGYSVLCLVDTLFTSVIR